MCILTRLLQLLAANNFLTSSQGQSCFRESTTVVTWSSSNKVNKQTPAYRVTSVAVESRYVKGLTDSSLHHHARLSGGISRDSQHLYTLWVNKWDAMHLCTRCVTFLCTGLKETLSYGKPTSAMISCDTWRAHET